MKNGELGAVIFDWSGVISDDRQPVYEANLLLLEGYGKPRMSFDEFLPRIRMTAIEFMKDQGINEDPNVLAEKYEEAFKATCDLGVVPVIYPQVRDVLKFLKRKKIKLGVLSSHPNGSLEREAHNYQIADFFDVLIGDSRSKAQGLLDVCQRLEVEPSKAIYVGDTIYDVRAAKEAGIISVAVSTGYHTRDRLDSENPDIVCGSLAGVIGALFGRGDG